MFFKFRYFSYFLNDACSTFTRVNLFNFSRSRDVKNERRKWFELNFDDQIIIKMFETSESIIANYEMINDENFFVNSHDVKKW